MKKLSRILTIVLCFAPLCRGAMGNVATTAGSNLTAFNPSYTNNNQWATMANGRSSANNTSAKADFGNCNALILRCAQPKCSNGGCGDMSVASAIVNGCVQSNSSCKQYGDDLVQYMSAQLVASSTAKVNEQNAAAANAAAQAAAQQSQQQMQQMQAQMQQMQQQMARQQAESQQQLQNALAQQAAQSQAAIESMKAAATAAAMENEAGISAYQQDAISRGISTDVLERQKLTGQIMTELENAEVELKAVKTAMNNSFEYAGCDARGNNCEGPKRIKKWRELAIAFITPYDETINKVYDALELAELASVNLSDIYMMLSDSCNRWGQYMCPGTGGTDKIYYGYTGQPKDKKEKPRVCSGLPKNETEWTTNCQPCTLLKTLSSQDEVYEGWVNAEYDAKENTTVVACASGALDSSALFARRTKNKNGAGLVDIDKLDIWLNQKEPPKKYKNGPEWTDYCDAEDYEHVLEKAVLTKSALKVDGYPLCVTKLSVDDNVLKSEAQNGCENISPIFAICDTHLYNIGKFNAEQTITEDRNDCTKDAKAGIYANIKQETNHIVWAQKDIRGNCKVKLCDASYEVKEDNGCKYSADWTEDKEPYQTAKQAFDLYQKERFGNMKQIIALKITVISQQMYKQYEYLSATLRRLQTQLEKATLTAQLEAAGAKSEDSSSSSGLLGSSSKTSQYRNCSGKDDSASLECFRENYSNIYNQTKEGKKCSNKNAVAQIAKDIKIMNALLSDKDKKVAKDEDGNDLCAKVENKNCEDCLNYYSAGINNLQRQIKDDEAARNRRY